MFIYYVYAYLRESDNTPYYIGKGKGKRAFVAHDNIAIPKNKSKIVILETNLSEIGAFALERRYIKWYGRKDLGDGILRNKTEGGEGVSGLVFSENEKRRRKIIRIGSKHNEYTKEKISKSLFGLKRSEETRLKMSVSKRKMSEETRLKMSIAQKNRIRNRMSEETKLKISLSTKGKQKNKQLV